MSEKHCYYYNTKNTVNKALSKFDHLDCNNPEAKEKVRKEILEPLCDVLEAYSELSSLLGPFFANRKPKETKFATTQPLCG